MAGPMSGNLPPGLDGYVYADQLRQQSEGNQLGMLSRLQQMQAQRQQMQQQSQMGPLQLELLKAQIQEHTANAPFKRAQAQGALAKLADEAEQRKALGMLSGLQSGSPQAWGTQNPVSVFNDEDAARKAAMEADARGEMVQTGVPNQQNVRSLSMLAFPQEYGKAQAKSFFPDTSKTQPLVKIKDPNNPNKYIWSTREQAVGSEAQGDEIQKFLAGIAAGRMAYDTGAGIPNAPAGVNVPTVPQQPIAAPTDPSKPQMPNFTGSPREVSQARNRWLMEQSKPGAGGKATEVVVDAIVDGRMAIPTGFALRSPYWQDVIERVAAKDPNFDATKYGARASARRTFASGPEARNVTAINTVIGHLGTLDEAAGALENGDIRMLNTIQNRIATEMGDPRVQNFDTAKQAVAEETMRVFRQVGASESEARAWGERITSSGSPTQLRGVIKTLGDLLDSRVNAIGRQYDRTVNEGGNPARVDPKNLRVLERLRGKNLPQTNANGWKLMVDANGNAAYVGPNNEVEEVK